MFEVVPRHTCTLAHEARFLAWAPDRSRLAMASGDGPFTITDAELRIAHRGKLPVAAGALAIHPTADRLALSSQAELVVSSFAGRIAFRKRHRRWRYDEGGDVAYLPDGLRVMAVCPADPGATLMLLDGESGRVIAERPLEVPQPAGFHLIADAAGERWALWAAAGQDGQWTSWISLQRDELRVEEVSALSAVDHGPVEFLRTRARTARRGYTAPGAECAQGAWRSRVASSWPWRAGRSTRRRRRPIRSARGSSRRRLDPVRPPPGARAAARPRASRPSRTVQASSSASGRGTTISRTSCTPRRAAQLQQPALPHDCVWQWWPALLR